MHFFPALIFRRRGIPNPLEYLQVGGRGKGSLSLVIAEFVEQILLHRLNLRAFRVLLLLQVRLEVRVRVRVCRMENTSGLKVRVRSS